MNQQIFFGYSRICLIVMQEFKLFHETKHKQIKRNQLNYFGVLFDKQALFNIEELIIQYLNNEELLKKIINQKLIRFNQKYIFDQKIQRQQSQADLSQQSYLRVQKKKTNN
ncbi:hypothetical protein TTHERM_000713279 (macronuclear) [Tetrahymena thermophila SB210]|uniref:Uncharacterized protein n=1 Tax=Tetrahymena thermophila (strain SB210) TaxID=312017 RepID=W7X1J6_TETTS|nr:hypothetical protein TTHERM_000713279 [Tetrahymena thermophila SB210]EWS71482.1 hypothetical protein TTHERM_000713279 [Tetrahymena thermophila SB210]|eukprot:XP_012655985.1 hypothetical protein TTHERM_000713279 [Tetrahymena thermophila SB210]